MPAPKQFEPKFAPDEDNPITAAHAQFPDPAERVLRVAAHESFDESKRVGNEILALMDRVEDLRGLAAQALLDAMQCEAAADDLASRRKGD